MGRAEGVVENSARLRCICIRIKTFFLGVFLHANTGFPGLRSRFWVQVVGCGQLMAVEGKRLAVDNPSSGRYYTASEHTMRSQTGESALVGEGDDEGILSWRNGVCAAVQLPHHVADTPNLPRP